MSVGIPFDFIWVYINFDLFMADVMPIFVILNFYLDRCYYQGDCGRFYSHILGRCYCHYVCGMVIPHILFVVI